MRFSLVGTFTLLAAAAAGCTPAARTTPASGPSPAPASAGAGGTQTGSGAQQQRRGPRPYGQVVTERAVTDTGAISVHRIDERWLFEVPDSLLGRDFLLVSRVAGVPTNFPGFTSAGTSVQERLVRWERQGERLLLRSISTTAYAADSLPIALSVASNNLGPVLAAFPIQAFAPGNVAAVIDVTEWFAGDTPALSGLSPQQRTQYQVRRFDPARSYVDRIRSYPENIEVRHTHTYEAGQPPSDRGGGTLSLEMRQSIVLLPKDPMRPRYADPRAGFFTVERVNYGLDQQKAATETFIRRWRLEPSDPAAYARGELVEPVKPIVYYIDPATPVRWRPYVRQGVEDWQKVFEKAGFRNAIIAKDPPSPAEDPDWDPEDIRYSVVRWAASTTRNAVGPSTSDPRTGEIIESDITWYHNHMRSYRNRLLIETGAANPAVRSLDIPEEIMGETMRQVITHEVGHAIGLPHNMIASSSFPVDSLRSPEFTRRYGVSATIMDYARQNYIAQPGDGLTGTDFIRHLGPFDDFIIEWGYRVFPQAPTPEAERPILHRMLTEQNGPMQYRYLPQYLAGIDPRSQTEDIGDDPVRASRYALANLQRVVPNLVQWTSRSGEDYEDLREIYSETLGMFGTYMRHVVSLVGGVQVDQKTSDQNGAVYSIVPRARQREALQFVAENVLRTPEWLEPASIRSRIGPGGPQVLNAQQSILLQLLDTRRLQRLADGALLDESNAYPLPEYLRDLRRHVWGAQPGALTPDANRRALHRVYVTTLGNLVRPPESSGGGGPGGTPPSPLVAPPNVPRSDLPALARSELRQIRSDAQRAATGTQDTMLRAHWADIVERIEDILEARGR